VSASYADDGVVRHEVELLTPPSRVTATPPHLNGDEGFLPQNYGTP